MLARDADGETPLAVAVREHYAATALALIREAPLPPAGEVLEALDWVVAPPCLQSTMWDLYPALAANHRLTAAEWARVPSPCHSIGPALPAVLERSPAEAALLVQRLPQSERQRLRTAALCLARVQRWTGVQLPAPILGRLLALSAAE